jgi:hypothetical protein
MKILRSSKNARTLKVIKKKETHLIRNNDWFSSFQALMRKILNYINIGKEVELYCSGGEAGNYEGDLAEILCSTNGIKGTNNMRVFQKKFFWAGCSLNNI